MSFSREHITNIHQMEQEKYNELNELTSDTKIVTVGPSTTNQKRVDIYISGAKARVVTPVEGTYDVSIENTEVVVTRTDETGGWTDDVKVLIYIKGDEIDSKVREIDGLVRIRLNMYQQMQNSNEQDLQINSMGEELDFFYDQAHKLYSDTGNNVRQTQFNTYIDKQYQAHTVVLKMAIVFTLCLLGIGVLYKFNIIPEHIVHPLVWMVLALAVIVIGGKMYDLSTRDNMNYDVYQSNAFAPTPESDDSLSASETRQSRKTALCQGIECCDEGMVYDYVKQVCKTN